MEKKLVILCLLAAAVSVILTVGCGPEGSSFAFDDCEAPESPCAHAAEDPGRFLSTGDPDVYLVLSNEPDEGSENRQPTQFYCYCAGGGNGNEQNP